MDKLVSIRAFTKVVELSSFSGAARELAISRSAISKYVQELEHDLGVQLLHRTTRRTSPTENGLAYYDRCISVLADLDEADLEVSRLLVEPRGLLRVNAPMAFGSLHLGGAIAEFMARYPELRMRVVLSDEFVDPVSQGYDVTIRIADLPSSSLVARKIAPCRRVICASPDYLARWGAPQHPNDLHHHNCLIYGLQATGNQWKLTGPDGDHWVPVRSRLSANNGLMIRDIALRGLGIAVLPTFIAGADLRAGALCPILSEFSPPATFLYAIYPPTRHLSVKVRAFIDLLVERFGATPNWDVVE